MSDEVKVVNTGSGVGFCGLLAIVFITLKLTGTIAWSWWLVLLPLYGPLLIVLGIIAVFLVIVAIAAACGR